MSGKWSIERGAGSLEREEDRLSRTRTQAINVPDQAATSRPVLVDLHGRPLLSIEPRRIGFRHPGEG